LQMGLRVATWAKRPRPPGTELEPESDADDEEEDADDDDRLWVWSVEVGGVAEAAGIVPGDEIVTVDGQSVETIGPSMATSRLSQSRLRIGQAVRLELVRREAEDDIDGDRIDVSLEAVAAPAD
jgi:C-terminal processing protease CtpA/Prc